MTELEYNGKKYSIPNNWDELTLGDYCRVFSGLDLSGVTEEDGVEKFKRMRTMEGVILSRLLGEDDGFCLDMPLSVYAYLNESVAFLYDASQFTESPRGSLLICGHEWTIPPLQEMPLRQYIDADVAMQGDGVGYCELLRCILARKEDDKWVPFDGDVGIIEKIPCSAALGFVYHFFRLGLASSKISQAFSAMEEVSLQPRSTPNS